jgi:hypothetical protein
VPFHARARSPGRDRIGSLVPPGFALHVSDLWNEIEEDEVESDTEDPPP